MKIKLKKLIVLSILIIIFLRVLYLFLRTEFTNEYNIKYNDNTINVKEHYEQLKDKSLYTFNIEVENNKYEFQLFKNLNKQEKIIEKVYYYKDEKYKCIFPIFKDKKQYVDVICNTDDKNLYYHNIENKNKQLINFVNSIEGYNEGYNKQPEMVQYDNISFNNNYNDFGFVTNYKGYYDLKNKNSVQLFQNDIYNQTLSIFINKYYIVADYNQTYDFDKIYVIDITNGKKKEIICYPKISFDSYIQGVFNNELYLYDKINRKQYKINPEKLSIETIGNIDKGIQIYKNNSWNKETSSNCANNIILFDNEYKSDIIDNEYDKIDKVGNKVGYYYFYKKINDSYEVYRSTLQNTDYKIYLFNTKTIDRIKYYNDEIYYIDDDVLKKYNDKDGIVYILNFKEFKFNDSINFGIYKK